MYLQVALPVPLALIFDYLPPENIIATNNLIGCRVRVPLQNKKLVGVVVSITNNSSLAKNKIRKAHAILDEKAILSPKLLEIFKWASNYYHYPLGEVFKAALPKLFREGQPVILPSIITWSLTLSYWNNKNINLKKYKKQNKLIEFLKEKNKITKEELSELQISNQSVKSLEKKGLLEKKTSPLVENWPDPNIKNNPQFVLHIEQKNAIDTVIGSLGNFRTILLEGVTGSGKTEVYCRCIEEVIAKNKQSLVLIPEINLTSQTVNRFQNRFACPVIFMHSQLTPKVRFANWLLIQTGKPLIIVGTRSTVFVPLINPGLFIIDESHDLSYKQQEGFRYSAKDVLIKRAMLEGCPILLGTATPALETSYNAKINKYIHLALNTRICGSNLPTIELLDIRHKRLKDGLSGPLIAKIKECLVKNEQVLLFLNRRGYAQVLKCSNCAWTANCYRCDNNLTIHTQSNELHCHHCEYKTAINKTCPKCQNNNLIHVGVGTQKLESILNRIFPKYKTTRVDKDSINNYSNFEKIIASIENNEIDILIGTQMLAKGHHFPNITLVAILDIDSALFSSDFRSLERLGQLITQVAGRAGRSEKRGHVLLQTGYPEHPLLQDLLKNGYGGFSKTLLEERKNTGLPPYSYQAIFRAKAKQPNKAMSFLQWLKKQADKFAINIEVLGPIPAPMELKIGFHRAQLLLQAKQRKILHIVIKRLLVNINNHPYKNTISWNIDVDPVDML